MHISRQTHAPYIRPNSLTPIIFGKQPLRFGCTYAIMKWILNQKGTIMHKIIYRFAFLFFLLIFIFSGVKICLYLKEAGKQEELYDSLAQAVAPQETLPSADPKPKPDSTEPTAPIENPEPVILSEYAELYAQNSDMVGWIHIPDTRVNYPVVQSPDTPNFYLDHGFDKSETDYGCPYVAEICDLDRPSDNLIIYGHHKKNGSMFTDLKKYRKQSFWEEHKTFTFDTIYEKQTYEVVAVFKTVVYTQSAKEFRYYLFSNADTPEEFDEYIAKCKALAFYDTGVSASYGDQLITLSTCEYSNQNGRLVVVAKKISD